MKQSFPDDWDLLTKINFLQRKIILNAIVYYELNSNSLSDKQYDELSKQLMELHSEYGDISDTQYGYVMYDFDGTTGFDLFHRLSESDANYLLNIASNFTCVRYKSTEKKPEKKRVGKLF